MNSRMKIIVTLFFLISSVIISAQTIIWEDSFEGQDHDWSLDSNWQIGWGTLEFYWNPQATDFDFSAISPVINLPQTPQYIEINQWVSGYSVVSETVEIYLIAEEQEHLLWTYQISQGNWGESGGTVLNIDLNEFASQQVQLRFRCYGENTYNVNNWTIYDYAIYGQFDNDLEAVEVISPLNLIENQNELINVVVKNSGINSVENFTVSLLTDHTEVSASTVINTVLLPGEQITAELYWVPDETRTFILNGRIDFDEDDFMDNNITPDFGATVYQEEVPQILIWDNDNFSYTTDAETGAHVGCEYGLMNSLQKINFQFQGERELPRILRHYDIVFVTLGLYCVS
ncbi:MAG: CARDB domain-containing protein [Candidatus Cloacimonetes bacterium]|nr:CARDB domain-containing protein [Candidatus Cloacimonadota bacterium]